eukprot:275647-Chlamydomonas_euryale.AAC.1
MQKDTSPGRASRRAVVRSICAPPSLPASIPPSCREKHLHSSLPSLFFFRLEQACDSCDS